jgi:signal transduction histidine kinase
VAWAGVVLVAGAVAMLLAGTVALSERRAAFVSAVTHELRTPLTTFHMYTEMLAEGMVADPAQQRTYLATLRSEAARLTHLVENVLAYARLERGRSPGKLVATSVAELLQRSRERLADRARQAEMELLVDAAATDLAAEVLANPSAVDQILFNLVDNACKYAASAADRRVHLSVEVLPRRVKLRVRDHGPGIARAAAWRLFRSFTKSAREAAESAPGVGLGLALSRRLARAQRGRLDCDFGIPDGACLVLTLERVP